MNVSIVKQVTPFGQCAERKPLAWDLEDPDYHFSSTKYQSDCQLPPEVHQICDMHTQQCAKQRS